MRQVLLALLLSSGQGLFALPLGQLSVSSDGTGSGTITSSPSGINCGNTCSASYPAGTQVSLNANPASGSVLASWNGDCSGAGVCLILISSGTPQSAVATFNSENSNTISLTVSLSGLGNGSVVSAPSGINCGSDCAASFSPGNPGFPDRCRGGRIGLCRMERRRLLRNWRMHSFKSISRVGERGL